MDCSSRPFDKDNLFSKIDTDYTTGSPSLRAFYVHDASIQGLLDALDIKKTHQQDRSMLVNVWTQQYEALAVPTAEAIASIKTLTEPTTFTITTAHQPVLFTGPVYFIYKAISAISLARKLQSQKPEYSFLPVFVIGGEDHDREEINHLHLFNKKIEWDSEQEGPCGRYSLEGLGQVLEELYGVLGENPHALELKEMLATSFTSDRTYGAAMQCFVHHLLGPYGLLVLNMDDAELKKAFIPIMKDEVLKKRSKALISLTQKEIEKAGYKPATYLRDINLFYLTNQKRERLEHEAGKYIVQNGGPEFTEAELLQEIEAHPERFSPNVNMRPLYQEVVLPNLAYIGGGGELAYWLERKSHFDHYQIPYPVLVRRDSVFWIDKGLSKKMTKLGLEFQDFVDDIDQIISNYISEVSKNELTVDEEKEGIISLLQQIADKGAIVDPTLKAAFEAEAVRVVKSIDSMASRIVRAEKHKHDTTINQIRQIKDKLFPGGNLQERHDNFMSMYLPYGRKFFDVLLDQLDPLRSELSIIRDEG